MKNARQNPGTTKKGNTLYFTSDHLAFFDKEQAIIHTKHLSDKTIKMKTRNEVETDLEKITGGSWEDEMQELLDELSI